MVAWIVIWNMSKVSKVKVNQILHQEILHQEILLKLKLPPCFIRIHHQLLHRTITLIGHLPLYIFMHHVIQVLIIYTLYPLSYVCHDLIIIGPNKNNGSSDNMSSMNHEQACVHSVPGIVWFIICTRYSSEIKCNGGQPIEYYLSLQEHSWRFTGHYSSYTPSLKALYKNASGLRTRHLARKK